MAVTVQPRPGEVYAFPVPHHPTRLKVGKSVLAAGRMKSHQTSNDKTLTGVVRMAFLDCHSAESFIKDNLADMGRHYRGEFYDATVEEVQFLGAEYKKEEMSQAQRIASAAAYLHITNYFPAKPTGTTHIPAVAALLLEHRTKQANLTVTVGALIQSALRAADARDCFRRLEKVGLLASQACGCAVFDKTDGGKLERFFDKTPAASTWRSQLADFAGFDAELNLVLATRFKKSKIANLQLIALSCRE